MKLRINKIIILFLGITLLSCSILRKENVSFKVERQELLSKKFEMQLPMPFHAQKENYEEGVIYFYNFIDSGYIIVFQGAMMEFSIDKYHIQRTEVKNHKKKSVGIKNNRFWRKDIFDGVRIYYDNVPEKNKKIYDKILDEIKVNSL